MTAQLSPTPVQQFFDNNGEPLFRGTLTTYAAGTTTPQATYVDSTQTTQNTNPIVLNFRGECNLWLDPLLSYKFILKDFFGNTIWTVDNIAGGSIPALINQNLIPNPTNTYTLGNSTHSWAQLYLGANASPVLDTITGTIGYYARTAAEIAAAVTPANYSYQPLNVKRYGAKGDGVTNDWQAIKNALSVVAQMGGGRIVIPDGATYFVNSIDVAALSIPQQQSNGSQLYQNTQVVFYVQHAQNIDIDFQGSTIQFATTGGGLGFAFDGCTNIRLLGPKFIGAQVQSTGVAATGNLVGGSGYTNGTYLNVPLTGGTGGGAVASIIVSGGAVTTSQIVYAGGGYAVNDTLSCSNTSIGGTGSGFSIKVTSISGVGPTVATAGVIPLAVLCLNQNSLNISCEDLDVVNCFAAFYAVADPALPLIASHISLVGNTRIANAEYGVALHNSGDSTVVENLLAFQVNRVFFLYGVQDVDIVAVGNSVAYGFQSVIKAYSRSTSNIRVKYTLENMQGKTTVAAAVSIQVQCDPAVVTPPPTVQNVFIDYYERNVTSNGNSIEFDYFAGSGGAVQQATSSNPLFNNIILRGECVNYPLTTVQLVGVANFCRINTTDLVQAFLSPGATQLSSANGFIFTTRFTYTPVIQFGGANTGWVFSTDNGEYYISNGLCHVYGRITVSTKGSSTGAVTISMPVSIRADVTRNPLFKWWGSAGMASISGAPIGYVQTGVGSTGATLFIQGTTSATNLNDTNFTSSSDVLFEATYPI